MFRRRALLSARSSALHVLTTALALLVLIVPARAHAYPWMIRHGYSACTPCHTDPSGSGPLTPYGRLIGDSLLAMQAVSPAREDSPSSHFLFGAIETPSWLELGGEVRGALLRVKPRGSPEVRRTILMQADLDATITAGRFVASGSAGYAHEGALNAALTRGQKDNVVSREHWFGYYLDKDSALLLRAGRMNLPFGIRNIEHTLWVRALTHTDINEQQQYGLAFAWAAGPLRGEIMAILGNYQLRPDAYRERGYSTFVEGNIAERLSLGVSSLVTHRKLDPSSFKETWRQVHGVHARYATPWEPLTVLTEWDYTLTSSRDELWRKGVVGYTQADLEAAQGVHFLITAEAHDVGVRAPPWSYGAWLTYQWFVLPHTDLRLDGIYQSLGSNFGRVPVYTLLLQGHVYL